MDNQAILEPEGTYHIYNRANGNERMFLSDGNYQYFFTKYAQYISPLADTLSYCLMPNHFHFLIRIKAEEELMKVFELLSLDLTGFQNRSGQGKAQAQDLKLQISKQFSNFFNAYAKAFNKQNGRRGSLFMRPYKRKKVTDQKYLIKVIHYIHLNPVEARLAKSPADWKYSSYHSMLSNNPTDIPRSEILALFGDLDNFIHVHSNSPQIRGLEDDF